MSFTMVDNICPGDHVAVAGVVTEVGEREIALELEMSTQYGVATTATAAVRFPAA
jgi:preprotein translocase subunit YajC